MSDKFLHKTVRAEWWINASNLIGPFPSFKAAVDACEGQYPILYKEVPFDIDPMLIDTVLAISFKIEEWMEKDMLRKKKRRNAVYLHENAVQHSMMKLAEEIRNTFVLNLENENASS